MNVTFLIGNGFDRNLGLATTYSEFINVYKNLSSEHKLIQWFRNHINQNETLWSSAEEELGKFTNQFREGEGALFSECHEDICTELAKYLRLQQGRVIFDTYTQKALSSISKLNKILDSFPTEEREIVNQVYLKRNSENRYFRFICFNYTDTLDKCLECSKENAAAFGTHRNGREVLRHTFSKPLHVHGTIDKEMVFGVNDETQISNNGIFKCDNGDIYQDLLIKKNANASYQESTDSKAAQILSDSHIIYIYGMSIGETDKLWWERICEWLNSSSDHHLILQQHQMPDKGVLPMRYQIAERERKALITKYGNFEDTKKAKVEKQIHITDSNIFADIKDIAVSLEEEGKQSLDDLQTMNN